MKSPSKKDDGASRSRTSGSGSSALLFDTRTPFLSAVNDAAKPSICGASKKNTTLSSISSTKCAVCAQNGPFSARQLKGAAMGAPARCVKCIEDNLAIPGKDAAPNSKGNGESVEKKQKQCLSDGESASDSSSSSSSSSESSDSPSSSSSSDSSDSDSSSSSSSSSDSSDSDSSSSSSDSIDSDFNNDKEVAKRKKKEAVPVRNAKEKKKPDNDSGIGAMKAKSKTCSLFDDEAELAWSEQEEEEGMDVSLDAIKRKVLGRGIQIGYDVSPDSKDGTMNLEGSSDMTPLQRAAAPSLKQELSCAICYEPFYQPVSLTCGHSFCRECLKWWLTHSQRAASLSTAVTHLHDKCPTCRRGLTCDGASLSVNTALRACVAALFGEELQARIQAEAVAKKKATAGENGSAHSRGYEVLTDLKEADWITLLLVGGGAQARLSARRSIVLDAEDQRMQLALSLRRYPDAPLGGVVQLELCLLTMEEDEAGDGEGFPLVLREEEDDEHFICLEERLFSCIEAKARIDGYFGAKPYYVPVARHGGQEEEGVVRFRIDVGGTPALEKAVALCFRHEVTGAELEIKLPAGGRQIDGVGSVLRERNITRMTELETNADSENDKVEYVDSKGRFTNLDEYEDDGFVVMEEHEEEDYENDDDSEEEDHDEEDVCCLCQDGGELIVCDGGDNLKGCGCNFHLKCVNRDAVPPGDWVCQMCANAFEFNVGAEGHEFAVEEEEDGGDVAVEEEDDDDAAAILPQKGWLKRKRNIALEEDNDDSDEEEFGAVARSRSEMMRVIGGDKSDGSLVVLPLQKSKATKKWCVLDSDDE